MIDIREHGIGVGSNAVVDLTKNYVISSDGSIAIGNLCQFTGVQVKKAVSSSAYVIALAAGSSGSSIKCLIKGIAKGLSGLTPGSTYYADTSGNLTTSSATGVKIGVALSATELLVKKAWWER